MEQNLREEVRETSQMVVLEALRWNFLPEIFCRVRPQDVAHQSLCWWFLEAIDLNKTH